MTFVSVLVFLILILFVVPEIIESRRLKKKAKVLSLVGRDVRFRYNGKELKGRVVMVEHSTQDLWVIDDNGIHYLVNPKYIKPIQRE